MGEDGGPISGRSRPLDDRPEEPPPRRLMLEEEAAARRPCASRWMLRLDRRRSRYCAHEVRECIPAFNHRRTQEVIRDRRLCDRVGQPGSAETDATIPREAQQLRR
jgi:hypothetical protein